MADIIFGGKTLKATDTNFADVVVPITIFITIALITYFLRIYSRIWPVYRLNWDDHFMTLSIILAVVNYAIVVRIETLSGGKHTLFIPMATLDKIAGHSFVLNFLWIWCLTFLKISIILMLLRIMSSRRAHLWGYGFIGCLVAIGLAATIAQLLQCRPISTAMVFVPQTVRAKCWTQRDFQLYSIVTSAVYIVTDLVCALLPIAFIRKLNRPKQEKIIIGVLMGLGVIAAVCGVIKAVMLQKLLRSQDPFWDCLPVLIATFAEQTLGVTAANIPCLKALFEKLFRTIGTHFTGSSSKATRLYTEESRSNLRDTSDDLEHYPGGGMKLAEKQVYVHQRG